MSESKTVKYHTPQKGVYLYAHVENGKTEMIVLNSTGSEQTVLAEHYNVLTKDSKMGREISSGNQIDLTQDLVLAARKSLVIEF